MPSTPSALEPGTLYVVATPIGNLGDLSPRAAEVLAGVDLIACEDTRRTAKLLHHLGLKTPTTSLHDHNERARVPKILERLESGQRVALVSDAGTPALADPGYRLLRAVHEAGLRTVPIPGPSALGALVSVSGLPTDKLLYLGFLPPKWGPARRTLEGVSELRASLVLYVSPHKIHRTLALATEVLGPREACLGRELTKRHEEVLWGSLAGLTEALADRPARGEYVLMVGPPRKPSKAGRPER
jgi:16S rRNA (cytidine1402-2'-O)-methyltransferase